MSFIGRARSPISNFNHANNEAQLTSRQDLKSHKSITEQFFYFLGMFQFQKCMRLLKKKRTNRSEYNEEVLRCLQKFVACENMYYSAIFSVASNNNNNNNEKHDLHGRYSLLSSNLSILAVNAPNEIFSSNNNENQDMNRSSEYRNESSALSVVTMTVTSNVSPSGSYIDYYKEHWQKLNNKDGSLLSMDEDLVLSKQLLHDCRVLIQLRLEMIAFYRMLARIKAPHKYDNHCKVVTGLRRYLERIHHPFLSKQKQNSNFELDTLYSIMKCDDFISKYRYKESAFMFWKVKHLLRSWENMHMISVSPSLKAQFAVSTTRNLSTTAKDIAEEGTPTKEEQSLDISGQEDSLQEGNQIHLKAEQLSQAISDRFAMASSRDSTMISSTQHVEIKNLIREDHFSVDNSAAENEKKVSPDNHEGKKLPASRSSRDNTQIQSNIKHQHWETQQQGKGIFRSVFSFFKADAETAAVTSQAKRASTNVAQRTSRETSPAVLIQQQQQQQQAQQQQRPPEQIEQKQPELIQQQQSIQQVQQQSQQQAPSNNQRVSESQQVQSSLLPTNNSNSTTTTPQKESKNVHELSKTSSHGYSETSSSRPDISSSTTQSASQSHTNQLTQTNLYKWFTMLLSFSISKFTIYFREILGSCHQGPEDFVQLCASGIVDYMSWIQSFYDLTRPHCVCMIYDTQGEPLELVLGRGYSLKKKLMENEPLSGIRSYPCVFAYPSSVDKSILMQLHWPNIISLIMDSSHELDNRLDAFCFVDNRMNACYYICRVDLKMYLCTIFDSIPKGKPRIEKITNEFMYHMNLFLRNQKLFGYCES